MIEIKGLSLSVGSLRIEDLNLSIKEGVFNILLGPTGSGKTLILETIIGLRKATRGLIFLGGEEIQNLPPERRGIAYLPQDLALFPHLTVQENIIYGLRAQKKPSSMNNSYLALLIENLRIGGLLQRYPQGLSGGEKQRVALARALAPSPKLLLLDEPLTALDPALKMEIQQLLVSLHRSLKFTALHVTHDLEEAYFLGDEINILIDGKLEQSGRRGEVFLHPRTIKVAQFLGLRNLFPGKILKIEAKSKVVTISLWEKEIEVPSDHCAENLVLGDRVFLYLRPEEVMILRPGKPIKDALRKNIFSGRIEGIQDWGKHRCILFRHADSNTNLEIHLPNYVFRNLALEEGQAAQVAVRKESFWVISDQN